MKAVGIARRGKEEDMEGIKGKGKLGEECRHKAGRGIYILDGAGGRAKEIIRAGRRCAESRSDS